jgi:cytochrome c-type biogenesis protein CcmH/NrfF
MQRHEVDAVSVVFGALFCALGVFFLLDALDALDTDLLVLPPLLLVAAGAALLVTSLARRQRALPDAKPPADQPSSEEANSERSSTGATDSSWE